MAARILRANRTQAASTVLTSCSAEVAQPLSSLRDQLLSKVVRFLLGWDVTTGIYDKLDFKEAGVARVATISAGNYQTGAAYATAVQTAMNSAPGHANTYTVTYSAVTKLFTIARTGGAAALDLPFATGANVRFSAHHDLGFANADVTGSTSYAGGTAVYQSRRWIGADFGSALSVQAAAARYFNSGLGGSFRLRGSSVSVADALTNAAPAVDQLLSGDADIRIAYPAPQTLRYWALLVDDTTNAAGYNELGVWYVGPYDETSVNYSIDYEDGFQELSGIEIAIGGAQFQAARPIRQVFTLHWEEILEADRAILLAVKDATAQGKNFFVSLNPAVAAPFQTVYGYRYDLMRFPMKGAAPGGNYWDCRLPFAAALP
jgi:hypothetical protein